MYFIISVTAKSYCNSHSITVAFLIADCILELNYSLVVYKVRILGGLSYLLLNFAITECKM